MRFAQVFLVLILATFVFSCGNPPAPAPPLPDSIQVGEGSSSGLEYESSVSALPNLVTIGDGGLTGVAVPVGSTHLFTFKHFSEAFRTIPYSEVELHLSQAGGAESEFSLVPYYTEEGSFYASPIPLGTGKNYTFEIHAEPPLIARTDAGLNTFTEDFMTTLTASGDWEVSGTGGEGVAEEDEPPDDEDDRHAHRLVAAEGHDEADGHDEEEEDGHDAIGMAATGMLSITLRAEEAQILYRWDGVTYQPEELGDENTFLELDVEDVMVGEFLPYARCRLVIESADGEITEIELEPVLGSEFMYGANVDLDEGEYDITVIIDPPTFMRPDHLGDAFVTLTTAGFTYHAEAHEEHEEGEE